MQGFISFYFLFLGIIQSGVMGYICIYSKYIPPIILTDSKYKYNIFLVKKLIPIKSNISVFYRF